MAITPSSPLLTQPQTAFLVSLITYPLAFRLLARAPTSSPSSTPKTGVSPVNIAKAREAISFLHCTGMTLGCLWCLYNNREAVYPTDVAHSLRNSASLASSSPSSVSPPSSQSQTRHVSVRRDDSTLPIIAVRPTSAHILTAIETAYLLQDSVVLAYYALRLSRTSSCTSSSSSSKSITTPASTTTLPSQTPTIKGLNLTHLSLHHTVLSTAFLTLQSYIHSRRDRGILVIVLLMLMNASSPFGTVRWWVVNFYHPSARTGKGTQGLGRSRKRAIALATLAYLCVFGVCRVGVIWWVLRVFGRQRDGYRGSSGGEDCYGGGKMGKGLAERQSPGAWEVYRSLRWQCQAGTGLIGVVNTWWLVSGWVRFVKRDLMSSIS